MQLYSASRQWATRPADERFSSLEAMHHATKSYADAARTKEVPWGDLRVEAQGEEMALVGKAGVPAVLTNYAFKQLSARVSAPAGYLQELPATLAAQNLNHGLKARAGGAAQLLFHQNGALVLRAVTSDVYERVWNHEVISRLVDLSQTYNLMPARTTMGGEANKDGLDLNGQPSRALYASDHDMYAFLMSQVRIKNPVDGGQTGLYRGVIVTNSEVGDSSLGVQGFWFADVCWNHIIWGVENLIEVRLRHVGDIRRRWGDVTYAVRHYMNGSGAADEQAFVQQTRRLLGATKDEVLDAVFGKRILSRVRAEAAYGAVIPEQDGDPRSAWGFAAGVTRYSQTLTHADAREEVDRAGARVLATAF